MRDWIAPSAGRPSVSLIYNKILDCITKPLSIKTIWNRELSDLNLSVDWERVWSNLSLTSKNLAHRLIHFKVIHRAYITPYKRFKMKLQSNFNCHICNTTSSGTFLHMFWECPVVISLWTHVNLVCHHYWELIGLLTQVYVFLMMILISVLVQCKENVVCWFYSCEEDIIQNWFTPHCVERHIGSVASCKFVHVNVQRHESWGRPSTIEAWQCFLFNIRNYLKEWLLWDHVRQQQSSSFYSEALFSGG